MGAGASERHPLRAAVHEHLQALWAHARSLDSSKPGRWSARACILDAAGALLSFDPEDEIGRAAMRLAVRRFRSLLNDEGRPLPWGRLPHAGARK